MAPKKLSAAAKPKPQTKASRVTEKKSSNPKKTAKSTSPKEGTIRVDPFARLPDLAIEMVISRLPTVMTETLRKVSKTWKYHSELHNGNLAIFRRFPNVNYTPLPSRELANLEFRRILHAQKSLGAGFAGNSRTVRDVVAWDIKAGFLAYGDSTGQIAIERVHDGCPENHITLDLKKLTPQENSRFDGLWLLDNGDVLVKAYSRRHPSRSAIFRFDHTDGTVKWKKKINRAAIGEDGGGESNFLQRTVVVGKQDMFFGIEEAHMRGVTNPPRLHCRNVVVRSLATGEAMARERIPETELTKDERLELQMLCDGALLLVKDKLRVFWAMSTTHPFKSPFNVRNKDFDVDLNPQRPRHHTPVSLMTEVFPSLLSPSWIERVVRTPSQGEQRVHMYLCTWDKAINNFERSCMNVKHAWKGRAPADNGWSLQWGMDFDQKLLFNFSHPREDWGRKAADWDWSSGSLRIETFSIAMDGPDSYFDLVLRRADRRMLRLRYGGGEGDQIYEKKIFQNTDDELSFLGAVEGLLFHFTPVSRQLTMLNFRPHW